ncbi:ribosome biogenesis GTP-binding protein YihA/YsxC [Spiroplasma taiwanense]|uniref:Probable GTP-binding protein EngB n=1 Tax=Spiroplasma taiwanense CT-1 TaxID=1276220 RepID=S5MH62_9MOLU|nr:ribosome biogenesis GTP-binding protein YihA/YsxC [Spiroplasma taiwanense]AGR41165.1 GTP-binding protein YsxC [Spiroplasma taiwanense CT-1]
MIKQAKFITSAANKSGWINDQINEVCFIGRSNVGKSTFINALTNQNKLAKTSSTPGKTRLLNFFDINNSQFRIVDAPGYGFARVSQEQKIAFAEMMDEYLTTRENLKFVCQLVDLRHKPTNDDIEMYHFFKHHNIKVFIVATKKDKCKKNDILKNEKLIKQTLNLDNNDKFLSISSTDKLNLDEVLNIFYELFKIQPI